MSQERGKDSKASTEKVHLGDWPGIKRAIDDQAVEVGCSLNFEVFGISIWIKRLLILSVHACRR